MFGWEIWTLVVYLSVRCMGEKRWATSDPPCQAWAFTPVDKAWVYCPVSKRGVSPKLQSHWQGLVRLWIGCLRCCTGYACLARDVWWCCTNDSCLTALLSNLLPERRATEKNYAPTSVTLSDVPSVWCTFWEPQAACMPAAASWTF